MRLHCSGFIRRGDVLFDLVLKRFIHVDLTGNIIVRGAVLGRGQPKIVKGNGPVTFKATLKRAAVQAAADEDEEGADGEYDEEEDR